MAQIVFTDTMGVQDEFKPQPASGSIPDWYKNMDSYMGGDKKPSGTGDTTGTIKRCMPVFDAIVGGYVLYTPVDVYVSQQKIDYADKEHFDETGETKFLTTAQVKKRKLKPTQPHYEWPSIGPIQFHPVEQAPNHPGRNGHQGSYPKWINPWAIKTEPGYSVLFMQPMHRESVFTILPGIVDTDTYTAPVNFPFVLNNWEFEGLIPAGTPMAQVIPFKRESWTMEIGKQEELVEQYKITSKLRTRFFDSYKSTFRQPKEYK